MNFLEKPALDFEFIDLESSGLGNESYPIEIGFTFKEHTFSFLIKPDSSWTYWDSLSEELYHGISREDLNKNGLDIKEICLLVNSYLSGLVLYSDGFNFDRFWVEKLFSTAKVEMMFKIRDMLEEHIHLNVGRMSNLLFIICFFYSYKCLYVKNYCYNY